jgi:RNA polymerase sigma-70 factor, ECF subfamily
MMLDPSVREPLVAAIPKLRAFVISLGRDRERAEDLVQRTLGRACDNTGSFERGSNMDAWLCTILRNHFYSECKRDRRASRAINILADTEATGPQQIASVEYSELCAALARLRDALLLVAVSGLTYGEAAGLCGCPVGTVKSRVNRAWSELARLCRSTAQKISSRTPSPLLEAEDVCRRKLRSRCRCSCCLTRLTTSSTEFGVSPDRAARLREVKWTVETATAATEAVH